MQMLGNAGMLNTFLVQHNLPILHIIGVPDLFKALLTSQTIWKDAGWGTIIFLAALSQIDQEQYEAAAVDGAGPWQRMWNITLPNLKGLFILLLILRLGNSLSVGFEQIIPAAGTGRHPGQRGARHLRVQQRHPRRRLGHLGRGRADQGSGRRAAGARSQQIGSPVRRARVYEK